VTYVEADPDGRYLTIDGDTPCARCDYQAGQHVDDRHGGLLCPESVGELGIAPVEFVEGCWFCNGIGQREDNDGDLMPLACEMCNGSGEHTDPFSTDGAA